MPQNVTRRGTLQIISVERLGNQAILVGNTQVQLNVTNFDPCGLWNPATFRFTPKYSGYYKISVQASFTLCAVGRTYSVYVNNPAIIIATATLTGAVANGTITVNTSCIVWLTNAQWVECWVQTSNPAGGTVDGANHVTFMDITKIN